MRKSTLLWLTLAAFCGTALFHTSQKVHDERARLAALDSSIAHEKESIRVLGAEWAYLDSPQRLETLAAAYLHLAPLTAGQFIRIEDIPLRGAAPAPSPAPAAKQIAQKKSVPAKALPRRVAALQIRTGAPPRIFKKGPSEDFKKNPSEDGGATTARNFSDLMKSLRPGVE
ncbi:MAG: hypothetical protein KGQ70_04290 [Alphaproteobacteria bacterium]|nr:hypothetical protein [Alphaproteobacteria bacterium]